MHFCILLRLILALQLLNEISCYRISAKPILNANRLESQVEVENVKEMVGKKWVSTTANVKINLYLQILGVSTGPQRSTYVNLLNVMHMLDYGDSISLSRITTRGKRELARRFQCTSSGDYLIYTDDTKVDCLDYSKSKLELFPPGDDNLIAKALDSIRKLINCESVFNERFVVIVNKRIPCGTGLGGGSADAAAVIKLATKILDYDVDKFQVAKEIGSDVPFLLSFHQGVSSCVALGKGNEFEALDLNLPKKNVYLFLPNVFVETKKVYDRIKKLYPRDIKLNGQQLQSAKDLALQHISNLEFRNDLLPSSSHFSKQLVKLVNVLENHKIFSCSLSGSGSACFGFVKGEIPERDVANELNKISLEYGEPLAIVQTLLK